MVLIKGLDGGQLSKLLTPFVDRVTCLECCKLYIAPETARCGHTYCHTCWRRRRTCPACAAPLDRRTLKLNAQIQLNTDHAQALNDTFEKNFKFKLDEFDVDYLLGDAIPPENDCARNVKEWLSSSQNQFSAQLHSSEPLTQDSTLIQKVKQTSKAQVHSNTKNLMSPGKVVHKHHPQDDWEKIELMPETEETNIKSLNNIADLPEIEVSSIDNKEYSMENPRRSSRKKDLKPHVTSPKKHETSIDQHSSKNSSSEVEKQSVTKNKKWGNVKRMKQEFSKLNKRNRSKLNISIEMCKKLQGTSKSKNKADSIIGNKIKGQLGYVIEDNTPGEMIEKEIEDNIRKDQVILEPISVADVLLSKNSNVCDSFQNGKINCQSDSVQAEKSNILSGPNNNSHKINSHQNNPCDLPFNSCSNNINKEPIKMQFFKKSALYIEPKETNDFQTYNYNIDCSDNEKTDDIHVTIKVGNTITNIIIKKNNNDVQSIKNVDQEVQTSLGPHTLAPTSSKVIHSNQSNMHIEINMENLQNPKAIKSTPSKKNTASAETVTANFEITESVEKELSNIMECGEPEVPNKSTSTDINDVVNNISKDEGMNVHKKKLNSVTSEYDKKGGNEEHLDDLDIFESGSMKETGVQLLKDIQNTASEILAPTVKSNKLRIQKNANKRNREECGDIEMPCKKQKVTQKDVCNISDRSLQKAIEHDSENINYDTIMGQVFASIDADIHSSQKSKLANSSQNMKEPLQVKNRTQVSTLSDDLQEQRGLLIDNAQHKKETLLERCSENVFTLVDKENEINDSGVKKHSALITTQQNIDYLLTPGVFQNLTATERETQADDVVKQMCTPVQECDDDDKSIVEETPQKNVSFVKPKSKGEQKGSTGKQTSITDSQNSKSIIDVSDTLNTTKGKDATVIKAITTKQTETPLTINKFVDQIKHKSTPVARKSLNFDKDGIIDLDDPEQTLCPTTESIAKTTQEKVFMTKAFEQTPVSARVLTEKQIKINERNICVAGSCLSSMEIAKLKILCRQHNWKYVDTFIKELTHLVVGVDDENKSQRSVKYMCALASSKWIVSFKWVEACLKSKEVVNEEYFEVLDGTGEPGPKRSRVAKRKLFEGISFYCMPPFSVLDVDTLKTMIEGAGGQVVNEIRAVRVTDEHPALLLAEPENTQENKFIYLAMELKVVPVNYEWVLNCLGSYTLGSIFEPLLCPMTLLPGETACWPSQLISQDYDEQVI